MTLTVTGRNVVGHSLCEWDPANDRPAEGVPVKGGYEKYTGCPNDAALCVGSREVWHLCRSCADLPEFKRLRKRVELRRNRPESA